MAKYCLFIILIFNSAHLYSTEYVIEEISFISNSDTLFGSLVLPQNNTPHSSIVFVHGSGKQKRNLYWAKRFASEGIAALVYDKRGVGKSEGEYEGQQSVSEKNIRLLADDASSALQFLHKHPSTKHLSIGITGISQAGWIAPLAAEKSQLADFLVLWSGPVSKVSEEDIYSKYTADLDHKVVPSFQEALAARKHKYRWPKFLGQDIDSSKSLANLTIPGLWIFGGQDGSIPVDLSIQKLNKLRNNGFAYEYVFFSDLGHNNMEPTFTTATSWIKNLSN